MDRTAFLHCQPWLWNLQASPSSARDHDTGKRRRCTLYVGGASFHTSFREQYASPPLYQGPLADDAVHLSFAVTQYSSDPVQLNLQLEVVADGGSFAAPMPGPERLAMTLDGSTFLLDVAAIQTVVVPQEVHGQLDTSCSALGGHVLKVAPSCPQSSAPFVSLIFAHLTLNIYPLGWKTAAARVSPAYDIGQLARIVHVVLELKSRGYPPPRPLLEVPQATDPDPRHSHAAWLSTTESIASLVMCLLRGGGAGGAADGGSSGAAASQHLLTSLAHLAARLKHHRQEAASAVPSLEAQLASVRSALHEVLSVVGSSGQLLARGQEPLRGLPERVAQLQAASSQLQEQLLIGHIHQQLCHA